MEASRSSVIRPSALKTCVHAVGVEHLDAVGDRPEKRLRDRNQTAVLVVVDEQVGPEGGELRLHRLRRGDPHVHETGSVCGGWRARWLGDTSAERG